MLSVTMKCQYITQLCYNYKNKILDFIFIMTYFDRASLYCTSESLIQSLSKVSPYCVISGENRMAYYC